MESTGITIVGLGPGNGRLLTRAAWEVLSTANEIYVRTKHHPAVDDLPSSVIIHSFDHLYETAEQFEDVYAEIVNSLLVLGKQASVIYAVPGNPFVGEATVTALIDAAKEAQVTTHVIPGISFVEPTLGAINVDGLNGLQLFDAIELAEYHYPPLNPDVPLLIGQVYGRLVASELKLVLMTIYPDEHVVTLVHAADTKDEIVEALPLYAIDRSEHINHLTSLYVPALPHKSSLANLAETVAVLRSPEGCS